MVRKEVADFITQRDGYKASPNDIFLTNGASGGVDMLLRMCIRNPKDGVGGCHFIPGGHETLPLLTPSPPSPLPL